MYKTRSKNIQRGHGIFRKGLSEEAQKAIERKNERIKTINNLTAGKSIEGEVTKLREDGAFVDLGGVTGFIHISEISEKRLAHPREKLSLNTQYTFTVLSVGLNKKNNISAKLSLKVGRSKADKTSAGRCNFSNDPFSILKDFKP